MNDPARRFIRFFTLNIPFALVCFLISRVGTSFSLDASGVSLVWPLSGVTIAALMLWGRRLWLGIWLGVLFSNIASHTPLPMGIAIAFGSTGMAAFGAEMLQTQADFQPSFQRVRDVLSFVLIGVFAAPILSAIVGATSFYLAGIVPQQEYLSALMTWWVGDAMGVLVIAPVLLIWGRISFRIPDRQRLIEAVILLVSLVVISWLVFNQGFAPTGFYPLAFLIFPFLVWGALRFDQRTVALLTLLITLIAVVQTSRQLDTFSRNTIWNSLLFLWAYVATTAITSMLLAATLAERKRADQQLRHSEARYRAIIEDQTEMICRLTPDWKLTFVNDAYCHYWGKTREQLLGNFFKPVILDEDYPKVVQTVRSLSSATPVITSEHRVVLADGAVRWHQLTNRAIIAENGQIIEYQFVAKDITESKEMEKQRIATALEHEKVNILADFIATASHDFRTPLSVINTSAYLLNRIDDIAQRSRHFKQIQDQTYHLEQLVDGLLTMSRLDRGDVFRFKTINLNAIINQVEARKRPQLERKGLSLTLDLDTTLPQIEADEMWMFRGIAQLVENAIHYTPSGGEITVRTTPTDVQAIISVIDTGIGITPEDMPNIFKRLYRGEGHRPVGGQGLGLSIAAKIVEAHQGNIEVESRIGVGSTFRILLPLKRADTTAEPLPSP